MFTVTDRLREGCHILSATTGRLKDMVEKGRVNSEKMIKIFILSKIDILDFIKKSKIFHS